METEEIAQAEVFEIDALEYDVGGAGAVEAGDAQVNQGAYIVFNFR